MTQQTANGTAPKTGLILGYFSILTMLIYLASPSDYFLDITTTYMLKNQLQASASQVAMFRLLTALPIYIAFAFGLVRDLWNPFGMRDRGYFLLFALCSAGVFFFMGVVPVTYGLLFVGMLVLMVFARFINAAYQGLMALIGQEKLMSGRLSATWLIMGSIPSCIGAFGSGYFSDHVTPSHTFLAMTVIMLLLALLSLWKPSFIYRHTYDQPLAQSASFVADVRRLVKHKAIYPAALIMLLFSFAPGSNTPLQFYLSNELHLSDGIYGYYNAIFNAAFIPTLWLYGFLCTRVRMKTLLWWGLIITVPQFVPLFFIHSATSALWMALPIGMMGGLAWAAITDLTMRSCPPGLQGTVMMLVAGATLLAQRGGDILGTYIYDSSPTNGFLYCVIAITVVYLLILPLVWFIPREIIATADGQANPLLDEQVLTEIGQA